MLGARRIPTSSWPTAIIGRFPSADWIGVQILNMFNTGSQSTGMKSVVESADSGLESADYSADSKTDSSKVSLWVRAFKVAKPAVELMKDKAPMRNTVDYVRLATND